jgi:hypothetical protein
MPNSPDDTDTASKTIAGFCRSEGMSLPFYFQLRRRGLGPTELRIGRYVRITPRAHAEWRRERERGNAENVANTTS